MVEEVVVVVVGAAAERMLEYTLDVVKLEPGDRKRLTKKQCRKKRIKVSEVTDNKRGKQS